MRIVCAAVVVMLLLCNQALAIAPVNAMMMKEAQRYGIEKAYVSLDEFLIAWTAYEGQAVVLDEMTERAHLYTPYLLLACDAREKTQKSQPVKLSDSEKILADYAGFLSFSVTLVGDSKDFAKTVNAIIKQGRRSITADQINIPGEATIIVNKGAQKLYVMQAYLYFKERNIDANKPAILVVTAYDQKKRGFYFDLPNIK